MLDLLEQAPPTDETLAIEGALAAFAVDDPVLMRRFAEGNPRVARAVEPLLAVLEARSPSGRYTRPVPKALAAVCRAVIDNCSGETGKARTKLRAIGVAGKGKVLAEMHLDALDVQADGWGGPERAAHRLVVAAEGDPVLEEAAGFHIGLHRRNPFVPGKLSAAFKRGIAAGASERHRGSEGRRSLLDADPAVLPPEDRGPLLLHQAFALAGEGRADARRRFDQALAAGAEPSEVARGRWILGGARRSDEEYPRFLKHVARHRVPEAELAALCFGLTIAPVTPSWSRDMQRAEALSEQLDGPDPTTRAMILALRGRRLLARGQKEQAVASARQAVEIDPAITLGWVIIGELEWKDLPTKEVSKQIEAARAALASRTGDEDRTQTLERLRALEAELGAAPRLLESAEDWAFAYLELEDLEPSAELLLLRDRLPSKEAEATWVVEAARTAWEDPDDAAFMARLFGSKPSRSCLSAVIEVWFKITGTPPMAQALLSGELDAEKATLLLQASSATVRTWWLPRIGALVPGRAVRALASSAPPRPDLGSVAERLGDFELFALIEDGEVEELLPPPPPGALDMLAELMKMLEARGVAPPPDIPSFDELRDALDGYRGDLDESAPLRPKPSKRAHRAQKKREKNNRKRGRKK